MNLRLLSLGTAGLVALACGDASTDDARADDPAPVTATARRALGPEPDLVIVDLQARFAVPLSPTCLAWFGVAPVSFPVYVMTCNHGDAPSAASATQLYLSSASGERWIASLSVPPLAAGECTFGTAAASTFTAPGAFTLTAMADAPAAIAESDEANNLRVGRRIGLGNAPDLIITQASLPASDAIYTDTVCNYGAQPAPESTVEVTLATAYGPLIIGVRSVPPLAPEACDTASEPVSFPVGLLGWFTTSATIDRVGAVAELSEANNTAALDPRTLGPNLAVRNLEVADVARALGHYEYRVTCDVCNDSAQATAASEVRFSLSHGDLAITAGADLATQTVPALAPGACARHELTFAPYFSSFVVGATVDPNRAIAEAREDDNVAERPAPPLRMLPELEVTTLSTPPVIRPGQPLLVSATTCNHGRADAPAHRVDLYASTRASAAWTAADPLSLPLGSITLRPLTMNTCRTTSWWVPSTGLPLGLVWLGARIDEPDAIAELVESNDTFTARPFEVGEHLCGDGVLDADGESCDDGARLDGDGCSALCALEGVVQPWRDHASGGAPVPMTATVAVGYHFSTLEEGAITALAARFDGAGTLAVFDRVSGARVAEAEVSGHGAWARVAIAPLPVRPGGHYTVALYPRTGTGVRVGGIAPLPLTAGGIRIDAATFGELPDQRPIRSELTEMFGEVDVEFVAAARPRASVPTARPYSGSMNGEAGFVFDTDARGVITQLGARIFGSAWVSLVDGDTGATLATAEVSAAGAFTYVDVPPVTIAANHTYVVRVDLRTAVGAWVSPLGAGLGHVRVRGADGDVHGQSPLELVGEPDLTFVPMP